MQTTSPPGKSLSNEERSKLRLDKHNSDITRQETAAKNLFQIAEHGVEMQTTPPPVKSLSNEEQLKERLDKHNSEITRKATEAKNLVTPDLALTTPPSRASLDALKHHVSNDLTPQRPLQVAVPRDLSENVDGLTLQDSSGAGGVVFNPMTTTPRRLFSFTPRHADDTHSDGPWITSVIATQDCRLVMADGNNKMVKIACGTDLQTILAVKLDAAPRALALLQDDLVAVTSGSNYLYLVDVSGHPSVVSRVQTARQYWGVSAGTTPDTLIVSCDKDKDDPAKIDVITREGDVIGTVIDSGTLQALSKPDYLCRVGQHVFVSDMRSHKVFRIDIATGRVVATLEHTDTKNPCQVTSDEASNLYIACDGSECVLVMPSGDGGQSRRLVKGGQREDGNYVCPYGVCVTGSRLVVARSTRYLYESSVAVYELAEL